MSFLNKIEDELPNYWELPEDHEKIKALRTYILGSKEADLIKEIQEISQGSETGIESIYDVFYELEKCDQFANLIYQEIKRAFESSKKSDDPDDILFSITQLGPFEFENKETLKKIVALLGKYINDENPIFRYNALYCLDDWLDGEDPYEFRETIDRITHRLKDEKWQILMGFNGIFLKQTINVFKLADSS